MTNYTGHNVAVVLGDKWFSLVDNVTGLLLWIQTVELNGTIHAKNNLLSSYNETHDIYWISKLRK